MAMELEVVLAPVSDVDQARPFYGTGLGWPEDADLSPCDAFRVIQVTPPGSQCSVNLGNGIMSATAASVDSLTFVVDNVDKTRAEFVDRGVDVSEPRGDGWLLPEMTERLPGRADHLPKEDQAMDVAALAVLLHETTEHQDAYERAAPKHDCWDWYASDMTARRQGSSPEQPSHAAATHMARYDVSSPEHGKHSDEARSTGSSSQRTGVPPQWPPPPSGSTLPSGHRGDVTFAHVVPPASRSTFCGPRRTHQRSPGSAHGRRPRGAPTRGPGSRTSGRPLLVVRGGTPQRLAATGHAGPCA